MKKLIIASIVAASFVACNNETKVESNLEVANASKWVDSISNLTTTTYDSLTWAGYDAAFKNATATIDTAKLNTEDKVTYADAGKKWSDYQTTFTAKMTEAKAAMSKDTMANPIAPATLKEKTVIEEIKTEVKKEAKK